LFDETLLNLTDFIEKQNGIEL